MAKPGIYDEIILFLKEYASHTPATDISSDALEQFYKPVSKISKKETVARKSVSVVYSEAPKVVASDVATISNTDSMSWEKLA